MNEKPEAIESAWAAWPLDREVVLSRVIDAPRELVFEAWTDPQQIVQWFGPAGMAIVTHEIEIREGGLWRFDMVTDDGVRFGNRMRFLRIDAPERIEVLHGDDSEIDAHRFHMLVTFDEQTNGSTIITLRQMHPSKARRDDVIGFGAVEFGYQTLDKLATHVKAK